MWARVHKVDRIRPTDRGAIVIVEDERAAAQMQRIPSLSTLIAVARVLSARRALELKYAGTGEVRYATSAVLPAFLAEAITRAGAAVADSTADRVTQPASPAGVAALIDVAFSELAHHVRGTIGVPDLATALEKSEQRRRAAPLDKDKDPEKYWTAVLELAALAGELSRKRGGRWVETKDLPVPFALKFPDGATARPTEVAQKIVEGVGDDSLRGG
jgi:hypothetical protein